MGAYDYTELRQKAIQNPTPETLSALGEWFWEYGSHYWNGESWDCDDGHRLRPIYSEEPDEHDGYNVIGYELI